MFKKQTNDCAGASWELLFSHIADTVRSYRGNRIELIDHLANALASCWIQFPLIETGEDLNDIDPFTFFASFCRDMRDDRRERLLYCLIRELDVPGMLPQSFSGLSTVDDRHVRFFRSKGVAAHNEIEALWDLFETALVYADTSTEASQECFTNAYNRVRNLRLPAIDIILQALSWIRPFQFAVVDQSMVSLKPEIDAISTDAFIQDFCTVFESVHGTENACVDAVQLANMRKAASAKRLAVKCFQEQWDDDAKDYYSMLTKALEGYQALVPANPTFDPRKEALIFAEKDPETTRAAFRVLFSSSAPVIECALSFEATMADLFEQYRGSIISAIARRSSHGNLYAISAYLVMRYPDKNFLFSPRRLRALVKATNSGSTIRISDPASMLDYADLCKQVKLRVFENDRLMSMVDQVAKGNNLSDDSYYHLLIEDMVSYAMLSA